MNNNVFSLSLKSEVRRDLGGPHPPPPPPPNLFPRAPAKKQKQSPLTPVGRRWRGQPPILQ
jgi:hypothetical protein